MKFKDPKALTIEEQIEYVRRHRDFLFRYTGLESGRCNYTFGLEEQDALAHEAILQSLKQLKAMNEIVQLPGVPLGSAHPGGS